MLFTRILFILMICSFVYLSEEVEASSIYYVKNGDTLWKISRDFDLNLSMLVELNPQLGNPNLIFPGEKIRLPSDIDIQNPGDRSEEEVLLKLVNDYRIESGLRPLNEDLDLSRVAKRKSEDMRKYEYVAHTSDTFGEPTTVLKELHINFMTVRENIGAGHRTPQEVFDAWKNSSIPRQTILDHEATHIGIGYSEGGLHGGYWTAYVIKR